MNSILKLSILSKAIGLSLLTAAIGFSAQASAGETVRVIISHKTGHHMSVKAAVATAKGSVKHEIFGMDAISVEVPVEEVANLKRHQHVHFVEEDLKRYPFASATRSDGIQYALGQYVPYGIKMVQADQILGDDAKTSNRKICIVDSGYDLLHEDLAGNHVTGENDSGTGLWSQDEVHHGSHVAGIIAATNAGGGVVGVNPNKLLNIHIVKVFNSGGFAYSSSLATAVNKCAIAGANVINMSLGGTGSSSMERSVFAKLAAEGILSIAAAGNNGTTALFYPASYPDVMSVAALDENKKWAKFSQQNSKVEIAAPGVNVLSTVPMGTGFKVTVQAKTGDYIPGTLDGSSKTTASAPLANFGNGGATKAGMTGKMCLIGRSDTIAFGTAVLNCQKSGGAGAIVYNNEPGSFSGSLGATVVTIPATCVSDAEGAALLLQLAENATVAVNPGNHAFLSGTSMATPHVSAVAALVWSYFPTCTGPQIRSSLGKSALHLGAGGRNPQYGFGLVQAKAAYERIKALGCGV